jgi:hypothetical protein
VYLIGESMGLVQKMGNKTDSMKIRIKIGDNEFDAEGQPDAIQAQMANFMRLMGHEEPAAVHTAEMLQESPPLPAASEPPPPVMSELLHVDGSIVSLSALSGSLEKDVLVLMLGQQQLRNNNAIGGTEIMAGLRASGHHIDRADHILNRYVRIGDIVVTGKRRRRRYRLTTDGVAKALKIAMALQQ